MRSVTSLESHPVTPDEIEEHEPKLFTAALLSWLHRGFQRLDIRISTLRRLSRWRAKRLSAHPSIVKLSIVCRFKFFATVHHLRACADDKTDRPFPRLQLVFKAAQVLQGDVAEAVFPIINRLRIVLGCGDCFSMYLTDNERGRICLKRG